MRGRGWGRWLFLMFLAAGLIATPAVADGDVAVAAKVSTLGFGVDVSYGFSDHLHLRGAAHTFTYDTTETEEDIEYDAELELRSFGILLDWHPFGSGFHLTAGLYSNDNEIGARGRPTGGQFDIGGTSYPAEQVGELTGLIRFDSTAPYVGLGFGNPHVGSRLDIRIELGVYLQGSPQVSLEATGTEPSIAEQLREDLREEELDLEEELETLDFWPVLSLGINYRF